MSYHNSLAECHTNNSFILFNISLLSVCICIMAWLYFIIYLFFSFSLGIWVVFTFNIISNKSKTHPPSFITPTFSHNFQRNDTLFPSSINNFNAHHTQWCRILCIMSFLLEIILNNFSFYTRYLFISILLIFSSFFTTTMISSMIKCLYIV